MRREYEREFEVVIGNKLRSLKAFRVQDDNTRGPYKGGIRFHPDENLDMIRMLARAMTIKTAVLGLPLGGAKGGVRVDPYRLTPTELEAVARGWVRTMFDVIGPETDIPAPDMGTTPQVMAWMVDEYSRLQGEYTPGSFTGKPIEHGGIHGRVEATAAGGFYVLDELLGGDLAGRTVAIQGYGNVGSNAARIARDYQMKVVAVSDIYGGIHNRHGIDIEKLSVYFKQHGTVVGFEEHKLSQKQLLMLPVDIIVPAATENQITTTIAISMAADYVLELANGPTTSEADVILGERNKVVIPDILANAGGVVVSYFEMLQNYDGWAWTLNDVRERLKYRMVDALHAVLERQTGSIRDAAYDLALARLEEASPQGVLCKCE